MSLLGFTYRRILGLAGVLGAASLLAAAQSISAQTAPAAKPKPAAAAVSHASASKVGVVNIQEAIATTIEGKKQIDALEQQFGPRQTEFKKRQEEVSDLQKQLQDGGDKLPADEKGKRTAEIAVKQRALQQDFESAQADFQKAEQEVIGPLSNKMMDILDKYAKAHGYTVILDVSSQQTPVLWAADGTNVTKELVAAYNTANAAPAKP